MINMIKYDSIMVKSINAFVSEINITNNNIFNGMIGYNIAILFGKKLCVHLIQKNKKTL